MACTSGSAIPRSCRARTSSSLASPRFICGRGCAAE
jgi:hypothetical protein